MALKRVNERSRLPITVRFADSEFNAAVPQTVRYRIDCLSTNTAIQDWQDLFPASTVTVTVTADQNAIIRSTLPQERKELTIECNYGTDDQFTDKFQWLVINLSGVT